MELICFGDDAFYKLIDELVDRIKEKEKIQDKWLSPDKAMAKLHIKSKATLQKLRDTGSIRFTQPEKKIILYDSDSIAEYLEKHIKSTF